MDHLTADARSNLMSRVRAKDTKPELLVRRICHRAGFRYRLHSPALPGKPDLVFPRLRKAIWVHGCFWHRHDGCAKATIPKSNAEFWSAKFERNVARDATVLQALRKMGWDTLVVWECETRDLVAIADKLLGFLSDTSHPIKFDLDYTDPLPQSVDATCHK